MIIVIFHISLFAALVFGRSLKIRHSENINITELKLSRKRFKLLAVDNSLHSSLNLAFKQYKLHNIFIFRMAYRSFVGDSFELFSTQ